MIPSLAYSRMSDADRLFRNRPATPATAAWHCSWPSSPCPGLQRQLSPDRGRRHLPSAVPPVRPLGPRRPLSRSGPRGDESNAIRIPTGSCRPPTATRLPSYPVVAPLLAAPVYLPAALWVGRRARRTGGCPGRASCSRSWRRAPSRPRRWAGCSSFSADGSRRRDAVLPDRSSSPSPPAPGRPAARRSGSMDWQCIRGGDALVPQPGSHAGEPPGRGSVCRAARGQPPA